MKLIDLTRTLDGSLPNHPYDDPLRLTQKRTLEKDHYNDWRLETGMHAGTHIDSPMHLTDDPRFISEYPLDKFCGEAVCLDVRGQNIIIPTAAMETLIRPGDIVLFLTGHGNRFGLPGYFDDHPVLSPELAELLVMKGIKMTGFDLPSPDHPPFPVHKTLFSAGIFILENLTALETVAGKRFRLYTFPLKIKTDSSPVRVVAEV
jgi:kynurenine formamidase